jgi:hypothetical protein
MRASLPTTPDTGDAVPVTSRRPALPDFWASLHAFLAERGQTFSEWVAHRDLS